MPHLSPLNWLVTTIMFWFTLMLLMTILWWQQTPKFPKPKKPMQTPTNPWKWN